MNQPDLFENHEQPNPFIEGLKRGEEGDCPCCGRYAKMYRRHIHSNAAKKIVNLYNLGGDKEYVHTHLLLDKRDVSIGDFTKAKYWALIRELTKDRKTAQRRRAGSGSSPVPGLPL